MPAARCAKKISCRPFTAPLRAGLALWIGRAGAGKSYVSKALRDVYQESGYKVVGLSFTNAVVDDMRGDGFEAHTVDAVLTRARKGKLRWDSKTVLVVDELGMLPNRKLRELLMLARDRGCKLVGIGDDRQLPAVERGGMFGALAKQFGANEISVIERQNATKTSGRMKRRRILQITASSKVFEFSTKTA